MDLKNKLTELAVEYENTLKHLDELNVKRIELEGAIKFVNNLMVENSESSEENDS